MGGYWLLKTEPQEWSWEDQASNGGISIWDGVRNAQAQKNLTQMKKGDLCFFYHTGTQRQIVGLVIVSKEAYPDPTAAIHDTDTDNNNHKKKRKQRRFFAVDVEAVCTLPSPVSLSQLKTDSQLADLQMLRQPRLSVLPVSESAWFRICDLGGLESPPVL